MYTLNADATDADTYIPWARLFANFHMIAEAADGESSLYDETIERIATYGASTVVISAADSLTPWADIGNAYISAQLSRRLRFLGFRTIGVGPFYSAVPDRFAGDFDAILTGGPSSSIVNLVRAGGLGVHQGKGHDTSVTPLLDVGPYCRDDVVMTATGCPYSCQFCLARSARYQRLPVETVAADIASRRSQFIELGDAVLPLSKAQLNALHPALTVQGKTYSCEVSVRSITPEHLDVLASLGVVQVKLGVESGHDESFPLMKKRQTVDQIRRAAREIKERGIRLHVYILRKYSEVL